MSSLNEDDISPAISLVSEELKLCTKLLNNYCKHVVHDATVAFAIIAICRRQLLLQCKSCSLHHFFARVVLRPFESNGLREFQEWVMHTDDQSRKQLVVIQFARGVP